MRILSFNITWYCGTNPCEVSIIQNKANSFLLPPLITLVCNPVGMTDSYWLTLAIMWTVNLSHAYSIKTFINTHYYSLFATTFLILKHVQLVTSFNQDRMKHGGELCVCVCVQVYDNRTHVYMVTDLMHGGELCVCRCMTTGHMYTWSQTWCVVVNSSTGFWSKSHFQSAKLALCCKCLPRLCTISTLKECVLRSFYRAACTRSSHEKAVCMSVKHVICEKRKKDLSRFFTVWKII